MAVFVVRIFLAGVFFEIFAPVLAFRFGAAAVFACTLDFLGALGFAVFFGALGFGFETFTGAGADALASAALVLAARAGCLRRGGGAIVVIVGKGFLLAR